MLLSDTLSEEAQSDLVKAFAAMVQGMTPDEASATYPTVPRSWIADLAETIERWREEPWVKRA